MKRFLRFKSMYYNLRTFVAILAFLNSRIFADSFVFEKCPSQTKNIFLIPVYQPGYSCNDREASVDIVLLVLCW